MTVHFLRRHRDGGARPSSISAKQLPGRRRRLAPTLSLLALGAGSCGQPAEGEFEGPAGFSRAESAESALAPATIVREGGRLVTRALRAAERHEPSSPFAARPPLGAEFGGRYDEGLRVVASANPAAFVELQPLGTPSHAPARLRHDGALVAYDDAYPRVSAAFGASDQRVEARLRVPSASDVPSLRYRLRGGPAFGRWQADESGASWAYDRQEKGLLRLAPPSVRDAEGRVVEGRWRTSEEGSDVVVEAELPWRELAFPVLATVAFETPLWFPTGGPTAPSPRAAAGLTFYGGDQNCAVLFGGYSGNELPPRKRNDVAVRCEGGWQVGPGEEGIPTGDLEPTPRQDASLAYAPFPASSRRGAYVFGGIGVTPADNSAYLDELWKLVLTKTASGERQASWVHIEPLVPKTADNWPSARSEAGLAWTGTHLLLFGGLSPEGVVLSDTWRFDGSNWQRLCDGVGCFPARRSFNVITKGAELSPELLVFGGVDVSNWPEVSLTNRFLRFTGAGWQPLATPTPATLPTLLDGSPSFQQGTTAPAARRLAWAAAGPGGQVLLGSGESDLAELADDDGFDVWRLVPRGATTRWARVPVTTARPGRRIAGSAVFDPLRQETLVVGGITGFTESPTPAITYNTDPPVAYRGRGVSASMAVTCHDRDHDGDCNQFTLEATATLEGDASPSRVRAVFLRQVDHIWVDAGPGCGLSGAPLLPGPDGVIRCEAQGLPDDHAFAVQLRDGGYDAGGGLCSPTPGDSLPFCNAPEVYAGTLVCSALPFDDGDVIACPLIRNKRRGF